MCDCIIYVCNYVFCACVVVLLVYYHSYTQESKKLPFIDSIDSAEAKMRTDNIQKKKENKKKSKSPDIKSL